VVNDYSSIIGDAAEGTEGIDANHVEMSKFGGSDDNGYRKVSSVIRSFITHAHTLQEVDQETTIDNGNAR
jgi:hypothetical protein